MALLLIGQISCGRLEMVTLSGNADAGWLAAFAVWHFDLVVRIVLEEGTVLYESGNCTTDGANVQLQLIYVSGDGSQLDVNEKTYRLQDATRLIMEETSRINDYDGGAIVAGRLPWDSLLSKAFGPELKKLQSSHHTVGSILGSLSRIVQAIATAENGIDISFRKRCRVYGIGAYGSGLVDGLLGWFPELDFAKMPMKGAARLDLVEAFSKCETCFAALKVVCNCLICQGRSYPRKDYCLLLLLEILFIAARTLSSVQLPPGLFPSRIGLETLYSDQIVLRENLIHHPDRQERLKDLSPAYFGIDGQGEDFSVLFNAVRLMSSRSMSHTFNPSITNAVSSNGICFCCYSITRPSCGIDSTGLVDVIPGRIEFEEKSYPLLLDSADVSADFLVSGPPDF